MYVLGTWLETEENLEEMFSAWEELAEWQFGKATLLFWLYGTSAQHSAVVKITNGAQEILKQKIQRGTRTIKSMEKFSIQGATK